MDKAHAIVWFLIFLFVCFIGWPALYFVGGIMWGIIKGTTG